ncbi:MULTISPECIES: zinc-binding dehydrogenase [unclassified Sphingomonas]|uniref:zinc-binding dehydrogenase n=1 Tax=unclassified Sphingomonas TaxID=196159 RepID=UPI001D12F79C|nr:MULTISPECIES: zinc-binding dehydrogenase [unclassified Sphingomonas]MCC2978737.1 zinc-binding dehydrogenase [Sphingomonas sp. IC4-52]MCD2315976.1 zinc-binding dehydrogenase [Sphingomonas sp. IC-11]
MTDLPETYRRLVSTVTAEGQVRLSLQDVPVPTLNDEDVLVRVEATPINPSDLAVLLALTDGTEFTREGNSASAPLNPAVQRALSPRAGVDVPVGNEGAGQVVAAGASPSAQALLGKTVALAGGGFYAQYRKVRAADCMIVPEGTSAEEAASSYVNPLTALGMVGTMKREGYQGLVHTAAASNLGQMLVKLCAADGVPLVNIVRSEAQAQLLRDLGAQHVVDMTADDFLPKLIDAIAATNAFLAFDAVGGGKLAGQILTAMEQAALRTQRADGPYGSRQMKQVYLYGGLSPAPTEFNRGFGMRWRMGGWLLTYFLEDIGAGAAKELRDRVARELKTTFASKYTKRIALAEMLDPATIAAYGKRATGEKYLVVPQA